MLNTVDLIGNRIDFLGASSIQILPWQSEWLDELRMLPQLSHGWILSTSDLNFELRSRDIDKAALLATRRLFAGTTHLKIIYSQAFHIVDIGIRI